MSDGRIHLPLQRLTNDGAKILREIIVDETAVQLNALNEKGDTFTHSTLLATPMDLIELHAGHLYSEGYVDNDPSFNSFSIEQKPFYVVKYHGQVNALPRERLVTSSCGACNHPDLSVHYPKATLTESKFTNLDLSTVDNALKMLTEAMILFKQSGGSHGSGLFTSEGNITHVSEDIGRHNAVDKTIGKAILEGQSKFENTMLLLSGRCGWDIVAKSARVGIPAIASLGAFSSAAVQLAREHNITLYGFVSNTGAWKVGY